MESKYLLLVAAVISLASASAASTSADITTDVTGLPSDWEGGTLDTTITIHWNQNAEGEYGGDIVYPQQDYKVVVRGTGTDSCSNPEYENAEIYSTGWITSGHSPETTEVEVDGRGPDWADASALSVDVMVDNDVGGHSSGETVYIHENAGAAGQTSSTCTDSSDSGPTSGDETGGQEEQQTSSDGGPNSQETDTGNGGTDTTTSSQTSRSYHRGGIITGGFTSALGRFGDRINPFDDGSTQGGSQEDGQSTEQTCTPSFTAEVVEENPDGYPITINGDYSSCGENLEQINVEVAYDGRQTSHYATEVHQCVGDSGSCGGTTVEYEEHGGSFTIKILDGKKPEEVRQPVEVDVDLLALKSRYTGGRAGPTGEDELQYMCTGEGDTPYSESIDPSNYDCISDSSYVADLTATLGRQSISWGDTITVGPGTDISLPEGCDEKVVYRYGNRPKVGFAKYGSKYSESAVQEGDTLTSREGTAVSVESISGENAELTITCNKDSNSEKEGKESSDQQTTDEDRSQEDDDGGDGETATGTEQETIPESEKTAWMTFCENQGYDLASASERRECVENELASTCIQNQERDNCREIVSTMCQDLLETDVKRENGKLKCDRPSWVSQGE